MKHSFVNRYAFLLCFSVASLGLAAGCSTGTDAGDTNVEIGHEKDKDGESGGNNATKGEGQHDNEPGADR